MAVELPSFLGVTAQPAALSCRAQSHLAAQKQGWPAWVTTAATVAVEGPSSGKESTG